MAMKEASAALQPKAGDALIVVDVQNDFLPGGHLAVPAGNEVVPVLNQYLVRFAARGLPIFATRDWHPADHCSFVAQGGPWPPHCVAETSGAAFASALALPPGSTVISKATRSEQDAYSGFSGTDLALCLRAASVERVFVGGLATDYCVLQTVLDALRAGFVCVLLLDAVRAVDVHSGDGAAAIQAMRDAGAQVTTLEELPP